MNSVAFFADIVSGNTVVEDIFLPVSSETIAASGNLTYTDEIRDVPLLQICVHECMISQSCYQFTYDRNTAACLLKMCDKDLNGESKLICNWFMYFAVGYGLVIMYKFICLTLKDYPMAIELHMLLTHWLGIINIWTALSSVCKKTRDFAW